MNWRGSLKNIKSLATFLTIKTWTVYITDHRDTFNKANFILLKRKYLQYQLQEIITLGLRFVFGMSCEGKEKSWSAKQRLVKNLKRHLYKKIVVDSDLEPPFLPRRLCWSCGLTTWPTPALSWNNQRFTDCCWNSGYKLNKGEIGHMYHLSFL